MHFRLDSKEAVCKSCVLVADSTGITHRIEEYGCGTHSPLCIRDIAIIEIYCFPAEYESSNNSKKKNLGKIMVDTPKAVICDQNSCGKTGNNKQRVTVQDEFQGALSIGIRLG